MKEKIHTCENILYREGIHPQTTMAQRSTMPKPSGPIADNSTEERAILDNNHHFHGHSGMCA
jgi:hypothetical protein